MSRQYTFTFTVECASNGQPDLIRAEEMINLSMQELIYDDEFVAALDVRRA
jgi:hypothetical protein